MKDFPPGQGTSVSLGSKHLAIFNVKGSLFAIDDSCPHRGAPLGDGPLTGSIVTCTWHGWEFDVKKGTNTVDPMVSVHTYPIVKKGSDVYVSQNPNSHRSIQKK